MHDEPRRLRPLDGIVIFGISQGIAFVASVILIFFAPIKVNTGIAVLLSLCVAAASLRYTGRSPLRTVKLHRFQPDLIVYSILASLALIIPTLSLQAVIGRYVTIPDVVIESLEELLRAETLTQLLSVWLIAALGAAVSEEFLFRGVLQNGLSARLRGWSSVVVTAGVFAILHSIWRFPPAFILGMFLGMLFWRTGSLLPPIAAHLTTNTTVIITVYIAEVYGETAVPQWLVDEQPAPVWMIVLSLVALAGLIGLIWKNSPAREEATESETVTVDTL